LLISGLSLHFPKVAWLVPFEWAHRLHQWSGISVIAAYLGFLALCKLFQRRFQADIDGLAMFLGMPMLGITGAIFLFPNLLPFRFLGLSAITPVALGHMAMATLVMMFLIHHLSVAPWTWLQKRRQWATKNPSLEVKNLRLQRIHECD
jgi:hypothetical protein